MTFFELSSFLENLEKTTLRNKMVEILAELFRSAHLHEIGKMCYLLQGRVVPLYDAIEFGLADKMMIRAIALGVGIDKDKVTRIFKGEGDLGKTAEKIKKDASGSKNKYKNLSVVDVYETLYKVATSGGEGSQEQKIGLLAALLKETDPRSARYIVRITLAKLRLGFSDMTILDALSWMLSSSKKLRPEIERAYNVRPDLAYIAESIKRGGIKGVHHVTPSPGTPILMAKAERLTSPADIIEKIGRCAIEPKYDGFRLQIHKIGKEVKLITRNLENVSFMYPDIVKGVKEQIHVDNAILEGEAIAYNPSTQEFLPFQETVQRKRKYDIDEMAKKVPLKLFAFDLLYENGQSLLKVAYQERRDKLTQMIKKGDTILIAKESIVSSSKELDLIFQDAVSKGLEGVMAKRLEGIYQAGARNFNWIKYKRSYEGKLSDTIDAVVMGFDLGQGKRTSFGIGDFLIGIYDKKSESFKTIAKIGTGLTDSEWRELKVKSQKLKVKSKPKNYDTDKAMECDVWVTPQIVVEIRADEITRSPVHTAGRLMGPSKSGSAQEVKTAGFALRFPRLERFREDKEAQDATTLREIGEMFDMQGKKK